MSRGGARASRALRIVDEPPLFVVRHKMLPVVAGRTRYRWRCSCGAGEPRNRGHATARDAVDAWQRHAGRDLARGRRGIPTA